MTLELVLLNCPNGRQPRLHQPNCGYLDHPNRSTGLFVGTQERMSGAELNRTLRRRDVHKCHCLNRLLEEAPS